MSIILNKSVGQETNSIPTSVVCGTAAYAPQTGWEM